MTITRTERYKIIPRYHIYRYNDIAGAPQVFDSDVAVTTIPAVTNSVTSTKLDNWRWRIRHHISATTGRVRTRWRWYGGVGTIGVEFVHNLSPVGLTNAGEIWSGQVIYPSSVPPLPSSSEEADNAARMQFYKRAKGAQTAFSGLTFLGELRETLHMLRNPARALRTGLDDYLKHVRKRARNTKRSGLGRMVSETWLEHAFGWSPLVNDIRSAGDALNRRLNRFAGSYTRVSGKGQSETASFDDSLNFAGGVWLEYYTRRLHRQTVSVRYNAEIRSVCENPTQADMNLFGVNWTDIVPTVWELIPYSFLVDYFTNIGDVLSAWSQRKVDMAWCNRSEKLRAIRTLNELRINKAYTQTAVGQFKSWRGAYIDTSYFRSVNEKTTRGANEPALPTLRLEIPGMGTKWINMSALVASRNRTRRQLFH